MGFLIRIKYNYACVYMLNKLSESESESDCLIY